MRKSNRRYLLLLLALSTFLAHADGDTDTTQYQVGLNAYMGHGRAVSYQDAYQNFSTAAKGGSVEAMDMLGVMLIDGIGIRSDISAGERWLKKGCKGGYAPSCTNLALSIERKDPVLYEAQARKWYHEAIDLGYPRAKYHLARMILSHPGEDYRTYGLTLMSEAGLAGVDEAVIALRRLSVSDNFLTPNGDLIQQPTKGTPTPETKGTITTPTLENGPLQVKEPDNIVSVYDEIDTLQAETSALREDTITNNQRIANELQSQNKQLESTIEVNSKKMEEDFRAQLSMLRTEIGQTQQEEIAVVVSNIDTLNEKIASLEKQNSQIGSDLDHLTDRVDNDVWGKLERIQTLETRWQNLIDSAERSREEAPLASDNKDGMWAQLKNESGLQALRHNDPLVAMTLFQMAAAVNYPPAINNLGYCYHHGLGTVANPYKARRLYEVASALNDTTAMFNLAQLLQSGIGGPSSPERAKGLLLKAGIQGNKSAALAVASSGLLNEPVNDGESE